MIAGHETSSETAHRGRQRERTETPRGTMCVLDTYLPVRSCDCGVGRASILGIESSDFIDRRSPLAEGPDCTIGARLENTLIVRLCTIGFSLRAPVLVVQFDLHDWCTTECWPIVQLLMMAVSMGRDAAL
jgi:hypothetical protein